MDYLVLLSIQQTCAYKGIGFLKFLLSGEIDLGSYRERRQVPRKDMNVEISPLERDFFDRRGRRRAPPVQLQSGHYGALSPLVICNPHNEGRFVRSGQKIFDTLLHTGPIHSHSSEDVLESGYLLIVCLSFRWKAKGILGLLANGPQNIRNVLPGSRKREDFGRIFY